MRSAIGRKQPDGGSCLRHLAICLFALALTARTQAQEVPPTSPERPPATVKSEAAGGVQAVGPEIFYLLDEDGNLLPVPDLRLEEYQRLYNQHRGLIAPDPPRYVLQNLLAVGRAEGEQAELRVEFQLQTTDQARSDTWIRIPLRLNQMVLREPARYVGPGQFFLEYQAAGDGYVGWLRADKSSDHRFTLTVATRLETEGNTTSLAVSAPSVNSRFELLIPRTNLAAEVTQQSPNILRPPVAEGEATRLVLEGVGGDFELSWRPAPEKPAASPLRLDASGALQVNVEGLGQVSCEAQLRVRSFGGPIDSFRVRLPSRMQLVPLEQPGYRVVTIDETAAERPPGSGSSPVSGPLGRLVEVRPNAGNLNELTVRLLLERLPEERAAAPDTAARSAWIDVGTLDVQGAVRQRGHIDFTVEGEYSLDWQAGEGVNRRDDIPEAVRQQGVVARFEYFRQPGSLRVQLRRKQRQIRVQPAYELLVGGGRLRLQAEFHYQVSGESAARLKTDFSGWDVDAVDRGEWAAVDGVTVDQVNPLEIPVAAAGSSLADGFTVRVEAHREYDLAGETTPLVIPLPRCLEATAAPATLLVTAADNVALEFSGLSEQGLVIDADQVSNSRVHRFREQAASTAPSLALALRVQPRLVNVRSDAWLVVTDQSASVEQQLTFDVRYEPLTELRLRLSPTSDSGDLGRPGDASALTLFWNGQPLPFQRVNGVESEPAAETRPATAGSSNAPSAGTTTPAGSAPPVGDGVQAAEQLPSEHEIVAVLPEPASGTHTLIARYRSAGWDLQARREAEIYIPLLLPSPRQGTRLTSHHLELSYPEHLSLQRVGSEWVAGEDQRERPETAGRLRLSSTTEAAAVRLRGQSLKRPLVHSAHVPLAWLQTVMTRFERLDRFSFRVANAGRQLRVQLPPGADSQRLRVAIDHAAAEEVLVDEERQVTISLDGVAPGAEHVAPGSEHVIEIWYWFDVREPANREWTITPPRLLDVTEVERSYWQLVVPRDEHLLLGPSNASPEQTWAWSGYYWGRQSALEQRDLETLLGGMRLERLPQATNQYLFVSFGPLETMRVVLGSRHWILLAVSGLVLLAGLGLIHRPSLRHPAMLWLLAVVLFGLGLWAPEVALMLGQAAGLGLLLILLARLLDWTLGGHRRRTMGLRGLSPALPESRALEAAVARPDSGATTATAQLALSAPESDPS